MNYSIDTSTRSAQFNHRIRFLVLHYTDIPELAPTLESLINGDVSAHYVIPAHPVNNENKVYCLVPEEKRAWHCGLSRWQQFYNLNDNSIGIEIVNTGETLNHGVTEFLHPYPDYQMDLLIALCQDIIKRYELKPTAIVAHADISPGRKLDPGPLFPWKKLYDHGVGAWPDENTVHSFLNSLPKNVDLMDLQKALNDYGYAISLTGENDKSMRDNLISFQMHFRPEKYDGIPDRETWAIAKALVEKYVVA